jgi:prolyl-tRNA editing enzyme YbaK/EbsC (Cys-tRNA(Pro) deacylase)
MNYVPNTAEEGKKENLLQEYLQRYGILGEIVPSFSDRLNNAVFVKSLVWELKSSSECFVLVLFAEDRVDTSLVAVAVGADSRAHIGLASRSLAIERAGYVLGSVPPIGHKCEMTVFLDAAVVTKLQSLSNDSTDTLLCGGGGMIGFDLLIPLHEVLKQHYVKIAPFSAACGLKRGVKETRIVKALKFKPPASASHERPSISQFRRAAMASESESLRIFIDQVGEAGMIKSMINLRSTEGGKNAFHLAAWRGSLSNVALLIDHGADIDLVSTGIGNYGKSGNR